MSFTPDYDFNKPKVYGAQSAVKALESGFMLTYKTQVWTYNHLSCYHGTVMCFCSVEDFSSIKESVAHLERTCEGNWVGVGVM